MEVPATAASRMPDRTLMSAVVALVVGVVGLLLLLTLGAGGTRDFDGLQAGTLAVLGLAGVAAALFRPRYVFLIFIVACMVVPFVLDAFNVPLGFMKLYIQDLVFGWNLLVCFVRWTIGKRTYKLLFFNRYMIIHFLLGIWALFIGIAVSHNSFDEVFGDFRRSYFYFMNYFIALLLVDGLPDVRKLRSALLIGACCAALKGVYEIVGGHFVYLRFGDAAHVLSHFEITFLLFMVFYGLSRLIYGADGSKWGWSLLVALGIIVVVIGNFRACWLALIGGLGFMAFFLPRRQRWTLVAVGALGALFLVLAIGAMWDVQIVEGHSTVGQELLAKADVANTTSDVNVIWRFESYANALRQWEKSPILGTGLGEVLEFSSVTSTGVPTMTEGHRVHNSFIWLLMSLGIVAFSVFMYIQARYVIALAKYVRHSEWLEGRVTVLACGAFYVSIMVAACFEIFLESAMPITVLSSSMALSMLMIYYTPKP